ncbi:MAG TPA: manganese efflux pump [Pyrinomonadaceae bacterium]|jgi:putative Mn2+ efflux pump MntP|nr:manganese efflux pump [Pyrinomonadaceae bacterium]
MATLLLLGFVLSLDSFRVSLGLGALKLPPRQQAQLIVAFGLCDGLAPLVGLLIGKSLVRYIGWWTEYFGPLALFAYGVYVIYVAKRCAGEEAKEPDRWVVLGLPLTLSLDNLVAGASLGMVGFPLLLSVAVIGSMSALMSFAGLRLGRATVNLFRINTELLGGVALVVIALVLAIENH